MVADESPVAEAYDGGPPGQHQSQADARGGGCAAAELAAKAALATLARLLARQTAAEAVEKREHVERRDDEARPHEP